MAPLAAVRRLLMLAAAGLAVLWFAFSWSAATDQAQAKKHGHHHGKGKHKKHKHKKHKHKKHKHKKKKAKEQHPRVLIASDTAADPSPLAFWGKIDCENESRYQFYPSGGDPSWTGMGKPQGNGSFRRLTVFDGDDVWGERCELGWDDVSSPVAFYREGLHLTTYASLRLPSNFPLYTPHWQNVLQMKQAGPSDNSGGTPSLSLTAWRGHWEVWHSPPDDRTEQDLLWSAPARPGAWTRFGIDALYSQSASYGWIRILVDLNGDGDFSEKNERGPVVHTSTLKRETGGSDDDGYAEGDSLPSHLRAGVYHDPAIPCPGGTGCSIDVDNIQIVSP